ncbi:tyrosine-protein phosphatase [Saccharopolyspora dendranthemae]|uniref:Tyrosine phosphatase family protein n=1 Tax=Saccharopolyspora dendranthemae TaxID=1181886 RepID=A0A561U418_9PSEU|nr:tyrosine-protein phosphatase [Saccharopolyspora dendranthemae]TWF94087.1 tyrosine phosphatase family protein [Saccharopolyspora dendranthemae]
MPTSDALDELVNLRDLGGQPVGDGELTRSGVVYRSDAPHPGDRDPEGLTGWPPRVVVDLREAAETQETHPMAPVAQVHRIRVLEGLDKPEDDGSAHELTLLYQGMLEGAPKKLVEVFRHVLEADGPALVHCAAGKDRTGVVSAMLLSAAGVRPDAIIADYVRTDKNMFRVLQRLNEAPELPPGVDEEMVAELLATPTQAIERVLEVFDVHQGAAGWLSNHGVTDDELNRWKAKFLDS